MGFTGSCCRLSGEQADGDKGGSRGSQGFAEIVQRRLTNLGGAVEAENSGNILKVEPQDLLMDWRVSPGSWADWTKEFAYVLSTAPTQQGLHKHPWWLISSLVLAGIIMLLELADALYFPVGKLRQRFS